MHSIDKSVYVLYPAEALYDLVDAVEHYPIFLPWCGRATVLERSAELTRATLEINFKGVRHGFTTRNRKEPKSMMHIELEDGPFSHLTGHWRFAPLEQQACKVQFRLDYAFSSRVLETVVGPVFDHVARTLVDGFVRRAEVLGRERLAMQPHSA